MWNYMKKMKMASSIVLLVLTIFLVAFYNQENVKNTLHTFTMEMDESGITGWHNGKKQWKISAETVTKTEDEIIFKNISNGEFMRENHSAVKFETSLAQYCKQKGCLEFPEGLVLIVDDQKITIGKAVWKESDNQLTAEKVYIMKTNNLGIKAENMIFDATKNVLLWQESLEITKKNENYQVLVIANQASYLPENQNWQIDTQVEVKVFEGEHVFFVLQADHTLIDSKQDRVVFDGKVQVKGKNFSGTCESATLENATVTGQNIEIHHEEMGDLRAGSMSVSQDEHYVFQNNVICSKENGDKIEAVKAEANSAYDIKFLNAHGVINGEKISKIEADTLLCKRNKDIIANGAVCVNREDISLESNSIEIRGQDLRYLIANGAVIARDEKGNVINAVNARYDGKDKFEFKENVNIKQNNGTLVQGKIAEYDQQDQQIVVSGEVKAIKTNGRWIKAENMRYDIEKKRTEFLGMVESGVN